MVAFPRDPEGLEVGIAFGANLSDPLAGMSYTLVTPDAEPRVTISRGKIGSANQARTTIDLGMRNPGDRYSPGNIAGPLYGRLRPNTPMRVRVNPGSGMVTRAIAYIPDWEPTSDGPGINDRIRIAASGSLRRLGAGSVPLSAPRRWIPRQDPAANAYWPLEDGPLSTVGRPDVGQYAMRPWTGTHPSGAVITYPRWSGAQLAPWLPTVASRSAEGSMSILWSEVRTAGFTDRWTVDFLYSSSLDHCDLFVDANPAYLPGGSADWNQLILNLGRVGMALTGGAEEFWDVPSLYDSQLHHVRWTVLQDGADVVGEVWVDGVGRGILESPTATLEPLESLALGASEGGETGRGNVAVGHVAVWVHDGPNLDDAVLVAQGWAGEAASERASRLCDEEQIIHDIPLEVPSQLMGPQPAAGIADLLRQCETTDEGVMLERRTTGALGLDPVSTRYNQSVAMSLNFAAGQVRDLVLADRDRDPLNTMTVARTYGGDRTVTRTEGPLGADPETGVGEYKDSTSRSLYTDDQAAQQASWMVGVGTLEERRMNVEIDLRAHPELVTPWLTCDIGSRIQVVSPPQRFGPAPLDLVIEGYTEVLDAVEWSVVLYCRPSRLYEVLLIGSGNGNRSRIAPGVSTLNAAYSSTATSLSVTSAAVRWITSAERPSAFPTLLEIAGEVMQCTAISGTTLTQTFTVQRGFHGVSKALPDDSLVRLWRAPVLGL